jgi:two-component system LytT family response regulator
MASVHVTDHRVTVVPERSQGDGTGIDASGPLDGESGPPRRFLVKNGEYLGLLRADDIDWARAEGNYTCIRVGRVEHLVRRGIGEMEAQLDHGRFLRISRSVIVNLDRVERLVPWFSGGYLVRLRSGVQFKLTRRYAHRLFKRVGKPL